MIMGPVVVKYNKFIIFSERLKPIAKGILFKFTDSILLLIINIIWEIG